MTITDEAKEVRMPKNVLIFSDGTGQAGGVRPDQRLSNVYKLYRASRTGPDSPIDPAGQVAFYDAGLGTDDDARRGLVGFGRYLRKVMGSITGRGITRNVTDCYEAILNVYEPGDRIFLFGFSRGAYTARCVAGVLSLCGVPTTDGNGAPLPRRKPATREIADEAVRKVYEHGAGRPAGDFQAERAELARRFRQRYGSAHPEHPDEANASPHFIGVFDTVASLGARGFVRLGLAAALVAGIVAVCGALGLAAHLAFGAPFALTTGVLALGALSTFAVSSIRSTLHVIRDYPAKGDFSWHIAKWRMKNYDRQLGHAVRFARHAIAIDETRADFPRVEWGFRRSAASPPSHDGPEPFVQCWFAGNHSDIGGSYPEEESRLSDIALRWMTDEATGIPGPLIVDPTRLRTFPSSGGMQHCEVDAMRDAAAGWLPRWWPRRWLPSWAEKTRKAVLGAPVHESVVERFALPAVLKCGRTGPYRPAALREDERFAHWYAP